MSVKPATDEQIERDELASLAPNLIARIDQDAETIRALTTRAEEAEALLREALPHVAGSCSVDVGWKLYEHFEPDADEADGLFSRIETALIARKALGSGGEAQSAPSPLKADAPGATTPAPSGAKESDDE